MYAGGTINSIQCDQPEQIQTPGWLTAAESWKEGRTDHFVCGCDGEAAGEDSCRTRDFPIPKLRNVRSGGDAATM
jgi:hypothetical protein